MKIEDAVIQVRNILYVPVILGFCCAADVFSHDFAFAINIYINGVNHKNRHFTAAVHKIRITIQLSEILFFYIGFKFSGYEVKGIVI